MAAGDFVRPFKQARRREDDISIVTAGLRVRLSPAADASSYTVAAAAFAFGGLAPTVVTAPKAAACLQGQPWSAESVHAACAALQVCVRASRATGRSPLGV